MKIAVAVDDDKMSLDIMKELLSEHDYQVITFSESTKALEFLQKTDNSVDLFLIDVRMKGKNGVDVLSYLKNSDRRYVTAPVIMMSTFEDDEIKTKLLKLGAANYVSKPFDEWVLMQKIREVSK
ncbi:MAG: response regulator [Proteobacteria bacterium]|nr:response regulator [Pseudomonadota bacterium]